MSSFKYEMIDFKFYICFISYTSCSSMITTQMWLVATMLKNSIARRFYCCISLRQCCPRTRVCFWMLCFNSTSPWITQRMNKLKFQVQELHIEVYFPCIQRAWPFGLGLVLLSLGIHRIFKIHSHGIWFYKINWKGWLYSFFLKDTTHASFRLFKLLLVLI